MKVKVKEAPHFKFKGLFLASIVFLMLVWAGRNPQSFADFWGPVLANLVKAVYATVKVFISLVVNN